MRRLLLLTGLLAVGFAVGLVAAADLESVRAQGSIHLASATSDYEVAFATRQRKLVVAPATADIVLRLSPNGGNSYESMTIRAGDIYETEPKDFWGFTIDRTGATVVDAYWE